MRTLISASLIVVLAACTGGGEPQAAAPEQVAAPGDGDTHASPPPPEGVPRASMHAGTDWVEGALLRFCVRGECQRPNGDPPRALRLASDRLLLFALSMAPAEARVVLRRPGAERAAERSELRAGDLMTHHTSVGPGRYEVTLAVTTADGAESSWRFTLRVPDDV